MLFDSKNQPVQCADEGTVSQLFAALRIGVGTTPDVPVGGAACVYAWVLRCVQVGAARAVLYADCLQGRVASTLEVGVRDELSIQK